MIIFLTFFSVILALSLFIVGLLFVLRLQFMRKYGKETLDQVHPAIFSFFASLYAFFLGFAIVTLWSVYLTTEANVTREADVLLITYRLSLNFPDSGGFRQTLARYAKCVIDDEWPRMEEGSLSKEAKELFDKVWDKFNLLSRSNKQMEGISDICSHLSEASKHRLARELAVKGNLYPPVWVIIVFGFISIVFCLFLNHIPQNPAKMIFDFLVVFMVLSCIFFIYDINTPFSGYIVVTPESFKEIYAKMLAQQ